LVEHSLGKGEVTSSILVIGSKRFGKGAGMHDAWQVLRWAWAAIVTVYLLVAFVASKRLRGGEKTLNHVILIVMAVLIAVRIWLQHAFGGWVYRFAVLFVGIAAGIAALIVAKMLISQTPGGEAEAADREERIQSLRLH
jgi:hypothetical protein